MTGQDHQPADALELKRRAEAVAREKAARTPEAPATLSPEETRRTLHELEVHQIELEMQNAELRAAQVELDASRTRYFDLYDLAPVGYLVVSETGLVQEANLTAATLLGMNRDALVGQLLSRFILKEDQNLYYLHRRKVSELPSAGAGQVERPQTCELRLVKPDGAVFWARLDATATESPDGAPACRVVMSDITERKRAEAQKAAAFAALQQEKDKLKRWQSLTVGRELAMIELKKEVNSLLKRAGQPDKYEIVEGKTE